MASDLQATKSDLEIQIPYPVDCRRWKSALPGALKGSVERTSVEGTDGLTPKASYGGYPVCSQKFPTSLPA